MFNTKKEIGVGNKKDYKKFSYLVKKAVGYNTIPEFANKCGIPNSAKTIADIIRGKVSMFLEAEFLYKIALGSETRVTFDELQIAYGRDLCGNYIELKNIKVLRGWICLVDYGNAIDSEQGGIRPSLVIQNNRGNSCASITMAIPLTSKIGKNHMPTHIKIGREAGLEQESEILVEQMRVISKRRMLIDGHLQILSECPEEILRKVEIAIMKQTGIVSVTLNESVVDRFLDKIDEYTSKLESQNSYQKDYVYKNNPNLVYV